MIKILLISLVFITACGSNIAYGDYVDTTGWSRKQIESIKNQSIYCSLKKLKAFRSLWKRCPVSSQQFECIIES